jgi:hypothetical protein
LIIEGEEEEPVIPLLQVFGIRESGILTKVVFLQTSFSLYTYQSEIGYV